MRVSLRISLIAFLSALGVILSPFWFPVLASKAYPAQHLINSLAGVLLGPIDAAIIAIIIGIIRNNLGLGTIYAFPGGIPGGVVVGVFYRFLRGRLSGSRAMKLSIFTEPIGTVLIGATLSIYIVAPWVNDVAMLNKVSAVGLIPIYVGWFLSSISGVIIALFILAALERAGLIALMGSGDVESRRRTH